MTNSSSPGHDLTRIGRSPARLTCPRLLLPFPSLEKTPVHSSEAYLSLSTDDPILASFRLRRELLQVANEEKYYTASC